MQFGQKNWRWKNPQNPEVTMHAMWVSTSCPMARNHSWRFEASMKTWGYTIKRWWIWFVYQVNIPNHHYLIIRIYYIMNFHPSFLNIISQIIAMIYQHWFCEMFSFKPFFHPGFGRSSTSRLVGIQHVTIQAEPLWWVTGLAVKSTM